jgi:hypothetical protein
MHEGENPMTPEERKVMEYHRQWGRENKISLWVALAIRLVPIVGFGVFLSLVD